MLVRASKCSADVRQDTAIFAFGNEKFRNETLPLCKNPIEAGEALASSDSWFVLLNGQPIAVFKLHLYGSTARISQMCTKKDSPAIVAATLRRELRDMKITNISLRVAADEVEGYAVNGFARGETYLRFSRIPSESNMMPILPLTNPTQKELPILSQLMHASYAKTEHGFSDARFAEELLRAIMSGARGQYLSNASFASGVRPNIVSACLLTLDSSGEATIEQVFTHPLYRARGLATAEIAASMNRLAASGVSSLIAWNRERNDVVRRLLTKMEFRQDRTVTEMMGQT